MYGRMSVKARQQQIKEILSPIQGVISENILKEEAKEVIKETKEIKKEEKVKRNTNVGNVGIRLTAQEKLLLKVYSKLTKKSITEIVKESINYYINNQIEKTLEVIK